MSADLRLAIPAAAGWAAAAAMVGLPSAPIAFALCALASALVVVAVRWRGLAVAAVAVAAAALCATSAAVQAPGRQPDLPASSGDIVAVTTQTAVPGGGQFGVRILSVDGEPVATPALVFGADPPGRVGIGTTIALAGRLVAAEPGDDVAFLLFATERLRQLAPPPWYLAWANGLREGFVSSARGLPAGGGDLLPGLAIGDTTLVGDDLDAAMKTASLSHLTAVSGANCAVVIGLVMAVGSVLGVRRSVRIAASLAVLVGFVVLVTPEPSVVRAAVMAALVLATLAFGRPVRGLPVLSLAVIAIVAIDPWLSRNFGFVLSVLATAGLLLLAGPLAGVLERWMPRPLALVIAVPVAAQLACQPVIVLLDASLPTYGVAANLLAAPAAPAATVVGLAACVLLAVAPPIGAVLCQLAWLPSAWIAAVAQFFAGLPGARLPWPTELVGFALLVLVSALGVLAVVSRRRWALMLLAMFVVGYVAVVGTSRVLTQLGRPDWQVAACDVGQGDAVLVRSAGAVALIDTGPEPAAVASCLSDLGVDRLDLLVLTHFDLDHVGGVSAVVARADRVIVGPSGGPDDDRLVAELAAAGARVEQGASGQRGLLGDLRWLVLWPPTRAPGFDPGNELSVALEFEPVGECGGGCLSSVFLGDLGEAAQGALLAANPRLGAVDVVKVSHHGSSDQSGMLYERLAAAVGVIGVGVDNGYGHPTQSLLGLLAGAGTVPARTDEGGLILLAPGATPGTVSVWTER